MDGNTAGERTNTEMPHWEGDWERRNQSKRHGGSYNNWKILRKLNILKKQLLQ